MIKIKDNMHKYIYTADLNNLVIYTKPYIAKCDTCLYQRTAKLDIIITEMSCGNI